MDETSIILNLKLRKLFSIGYYNPPKQTQNAENNGQSSEVTYLRLQVFRFRDWKDQPGLVGGMEGTSFKRNTTFFGARASVLLLAKQNVTKFNQRTLCALLLKVDRRLALQKTSDLKFFETFNNDHLRTQYIYLAKLPSARLGMRNKLQSVFPQMSADALTPHVTCLFILSSSAFACRLSGSSFKTSL